MSLFKIVFELLNILILIFIKFKKEENVNTSKNQILLTGFDSSKFYI
jgi:hypothetical protein